MTRREISVLIVCLAAVFPPAFARAAAESTDPSSDVPALIEQLGDADATVRKLAGERLTAIGAGARAQLVKASRSGDPELRAGAAQILLKLPWSRPGDPPETRPLLERYSGAEENTRIEIIWRLDNDAKAPDVLVRLLQEDPSERIRWMIVATLADDLRGRVQQQLRQLATDDDDPPTLTIAGMAWMSKEKARALELFRRAIDADAERTTPDGGALGYAFEMLTRAALDAGRFDEAAELLRRQIPRGGSWVSPRRRRRLSDEGQMSAAARLLALHTYFGPLKGYAFDAEVWASISATTPRVTDNLLRLFARLGTAPPLPRMFTAGLSADDRYAAAYFLLEQEWVDAADLELQSALAAIPERDQFAAANLVFLTARIASARKDDDAAAAAMERGMQLKARLQLTLVGRTDDDVWSEIHWRRARAAAARGDTAAINQSVRDLLQFAPTNSDLAINMVQWLKENGRVADAKKLFEKIYVQSRARVDSTQKNSARLANDLAWLCARCGENLDEALNLAKSAVAAEPDNAAFLDTLAEAHFRLGHSDEAVKLETAALEYRPDDKFMKEQLERFKAGAGKP